MIRVLLSVVVLAVLASTASAGLFSNLLGLRNVQRSGCPGGNCSAVRPLPTAPQPSGSAVKPLPAKPPKPLPIAPKPAPVK